MASRNIRYFVSVVLCILSSQAASFARDYYVSAVGGNDGNSGLSSTAPWRSIAKVNATSFAPGDRIFFARGGIWRESLLPRTSGVAGSPITFGAYGSGTLPVLTGSNDLTSGRTWRKSVSGTNTYYCYASGIEPPDMVWLNGVNGARGTAGSLADHQWDWNDRDSLGFSTVYIRDDSGSPSTTGVLIESAARTTCVSLSGQHHLVFENLELRHGDNYSTSVGIFNAVSCASVTVRNCKIHDGVSFVARFRGTGTAGITIENCEIYNALNTWTYSQCLAIRDCNGARVRGNRIYNALGRVAACVSVLGSSSNVVFEDNEVYNGIGDLVYLREGSHDNIVRWNHIHGTTSMRSSNAVMMRQGANNNRVYGNLIVRVSVAIQISDVDGVTTGNKIYNNTIDNRDISTETIYVRGSHTNTEIKNNIIYTNNGSGDYALWVNTAGMVTSNYNRWYNTGTGPTWYWVGTSYTQSQFSNYKTASGQDRNSSTGDPGFVSSSDRHLSSGSPCIDAGTNVGVTEDYDGTMIPQGSAPDVGAYEYAHAATYTLAISATNGSVTKTPNQTSYTLGTTVTLQATPNSGYVFTGWSGDLTGTTNPATLVMNSNKSVTANFAAVTYTLTISATNGSVTKTPNQTSYTSGTTVTLQATPNSGYVFTGWSGDLTGTTNPATITMNSNKSVTANFTASAGSTTKTIGTTTVLPNVTKDARRQAMPYTMPEAGRLQSISMYHEVGSGQMILGVYADSSGKPGSRLGVTSSTTVSGTQGWQRVNLQSPVSVSAGQKIWLAWVYQNNPGARYASGTPARATSSALWSAGMPTKFGSSTIGTNIYSIYATYTTTTSTTASYAAADVASGGMMAETPSTGDTLAGVVTPKGKDDVPQTRGTSKAAERARTPKAVEGATDDQEQTPPAVDDGSLMPDSGTTPNTMMLLHVRDAGKGVNPASVSIEVDDHLVYSGDVESSSTAYGICVRTGTKADYTYMYQSHESTGEQVVVTVNARDLAGNVMPEQTYLFDAAASVPAPTQTVAPEQAGVDQNSVSDEVAPDQSDLDQRRPAVATDGKGNTWSAWQAGDAGQRQIYLSRMSESTETSGDTVQVSQGEGDHCNPAIAVDGAGVLYVVWQESTRGNWNVCTSVSLDGKAWSAPKAIVDANDNQVNPAIAASGQPDGLVAVLWQDDRAGNQDVYMAISTDAFTTAEVTPMTFDGADHTDPAVFVDGEDAIFMRWTDTRNDSTASEEFPQEL